MSSRRPSVRGMSSKTRSVRTSSVWAPSLSPRGLSDDKGRERTKAKAKVSTLKDIASFRGRREVEEEVVQCGRAYMFDIN